MQFSKYKHNPIELIKEYWPELDVSHITYNPKLKPSQRDYWRIAAETHDGTMLFTEQMLMRCLERLVFKTSVFKDAEPEKYNDVSYEVGPMLHAVVRGKVRLPAGWYAGQRESVKIPVKCNFIV